MSEDGLIGISEKFERVFARLDKIDLKNETYDEIFRSNERERIAMRSQIEWQGREIKSITDDIKDIHSDTRWLRRTISGAVIGAASTGLIGGFIGVLWTLMGR